MLDLTLGYEVLLQPAVFAAGVLYAIYHLLKGFYRTEIQVDEIPVKVTRWKATGVRKAAMGFGVAVIFVLGTVVVPFGHRGVIWSTGGVDYTEREPGLSFIIPVVQSDVVVDVRERRFTTVYKDGEDKGKANGFVQTSDLQEVTVKASLVYRINPDQAAEIYDNVGPEYETAIIEEVLYDAVKEAGGACVPDEEGNCTRTALSFARQLNDIANEIKDIVTPELEARGLQVLTVSVEDAIFDEQFIQAVKEKVIADEEAAEQRKLVEAERAKKEQRILAAEALEQEKLIAARGEEQAIQQIAQALGFTPQEYLEWLLLTQWDGVLPDTLVGSGTGLDLLLAPQGGVE